MAASVRGAADMIATADHATSCSGSRAEREPDALLKRVGIGKGAEIQIGHELFSRLCHARSACSRMVMLGASAAAAR